MTDRPQLSPDLRPLRYCPNCGQRVAQRAETCFMCGSDLELRRRHSWRLPLGDLLLIAVVVGVVYLWWSRGGPDEPVSAVRPTPTALAEQAVSAITPTPTLTPTPSPTPTVTATPTPIIYTVVAGDTVEKIAAQFGISVEDLMVANGLTSDLIRVDQKLLIPPGPLPRGPDGRPLPTATPTPRVGIYQVVVRPGDTLENIAARLETSVAAIIAANDWIENADTVIQPGQVILVPVGDAWATLTPTPIMLPTATPVPTPTPTPGPRWPAPHLLSPLDGARFRGGEVLLQWLAVGMLGADEVYVVRVAPAGRLREELSAVTLGTSFRVPEEWLEQHSRRADYFLWSVQVARDVRAVAGETAGLWAASPSSVPRRFYWQPAPSAR